MEDVYIMKEEALAAIRRIEGVVKPSSPTIGDVGDPDVKKIIHCEQCHNYRRRVVDLDIIIQFEHCRKGIRFDNPRTFYCGYAIQRGELDGDQ